MDFLKAYTAQLLSVLRIMSGLLLLQHGTTKYLSVPPGPMNNAWAPGRVYLCARSIPHT